MKISSKIVNEIPLKSLWNDKRTIQAKRERYLTKKELKELLDQHPVKFVIANIGENLKWIPIENCFGNWKSKIKENVVQNLDSIEFDNFPNKFAYIASEWSEMLTLQ